MTTYPKFVLVAAASVWVPGEVQKLRHDPDWIVNLYRPRTLYCRGHLNLCTILQVICFQVFTSTLHLVDAQLPKFMSLAKINQFSHMQFNK